MLRKPLESGTPESLAPAGPRGLFSSRRRGMAERQGGRRDRPEKAEGGPAEEAEEEAGEASGALPSGAGFDRRSGKGGLRLRRRALRSFPLRRLPSLLMARRTEGWVYACVRRAPDDLPGDPCRLRQLGVQPRGRQSNGAFQRTKVIRCDARPSDACSPIRTSSSGRGTATGGSF